MGAEGLTLLGGELTLEQDLENQRCACVEVAEMALPERETSGHVASPQWGLGGGAELERSSDTLADIVTGSSTYDGATAR